MYKKYLKVKVGSRDSEGKEISKGGTIVRSKIIPVIKKGTPIEVRTTNVTIPFVGKTHYYESELNFNQGLVLHPNDLL